MYRKESQAKFRRTETLSILSLWFFYKLTWMFDFHWMYGNLNMTSTKFLSLITYRLLMSLALAVLPLVGVVRPRRPGVPRPQSNLKFRLWFEVSFTIFRRAFNVINTFFYFRYLNSVYGLLYFDRLTLVTAKVSESVSS